MTSPNPRDQDQTAALWGRRRQPRPRATSHTGYLKSIGCRLDLLDALANPALTTVLIEDLCWRFAAAAAPTGKPPIWRRTERARWRATLAARYTMRNRIVDRAIDAGLAVPPLTAQDWVRSR